MNWQKENEPYFLLFLLFTFADMCLPGKILPTVSIESKNENAGVPGGNSSSMISFELPVIIDKIKTLLIEGMLPENIAVIYHDKDTGKLISQYFEAEKIPF